jgi:hypothetical protein
MLTDCSAYWTDMSEDNGGRLDIDWLRTMAGALAAVSSAVLLSTLGAAGTLIGAALGSVVATVGGALYTQGLASSREQLARAQSAARHHVGIAQSELRRAQRQPGDGAAGDAHVAQAEERLEEAQDELDTLDEEPALPDWRERIRALPWRQISILAAGVFVAAILAITAFELATGDSVSEITGGTDGEGGTTISRLGGGSDDAGSKDESPKDDQPDEQEAPAGRPSDEPSADTSATTKPDETPTSAPSGTPTSGPTLEVPSETTEPSEPAPSP